MSTFEPGGSRLPILGEQDKRLPVPLFTPRELGCIEIALKGFINNFALGGTTGDPDADELLGAAAESAHAKVHETLTILNDRNQ